MRTKAIIKRGRVYSIYFSGLMSIYFHENPPIFSFIREELRMFWRYARREENDLSVLRDELVESYFKKAFINRGGCGEIRKIIVENTVRRYCNWLPTICNTKSLVHAPSKMSVRREKFAADTMKGTKKLKYDVVNELIAYYGRAAAHMPTARDFDGIKKTIQELKGTQYVHIWADMAAIAEVAGLQEEFKEYKSKHWYARKDKQNKDDEILENKEEPVVKRKVDLQYTRRERERSIAELDEQCSLVRAMMRKYNY